MEIFGNKGMFLILTFKLTSTIFSAVILGVGLHSHYRSSWITQSIQWKQLNASDEDVETLYNSTSTVKAFQLCQAHNVLIEWGLTKEMKCPEVKMEEFFIWVIVITFAGSLGGLLMLWSRLVDMDMKCWQFLEIAYHGISTVFLMVAGIVYIWSANQIPGFMKPLYDNDTFRKNLRTQEKIAAGAFVIMQSVLYALITGLIGHRMRS